MKCEYCTLDNSIVSMLSFLIWSLYSGYIKNALILRKYTLMYLGQMDRMLAIHFHTVQEKKCVCMRGGRKNEWQSKQMKQTSNDQWIWINDIGEFFVLFL